MGNFVSKKLLRTDVRELQPVERGNAVLARTQPKPQYHVAPKRGWTNDPNGPVKVKGRYHLFYQHVPNKSVWDFGIVWGHASSTDLVHWEHHEHALKPTPGAFDADGCFSGCSVVDSDGFVVILYTGVRKRDNPNCGALPPPDQDLNLEFIETQLSASANPDDGKLKWEKQAPPVIPLPPKNLALVGWRDPFVLPRSPMDDEWTMLVGSGIKGQGGAVMVYKSSTLTSGWHFVGFLASGDGDTGAMWECPLLAKLPVTQKMNQSLPLMQKCPSVESSLYDLCEDPDGSMDLAKRGSRRSCSIDVSALTINSFRIKSALERVEEGGSQYFFCISPDAKENPVLYWLGDYRDGKFIIEEAKGPFLLDLGDVVYAPNLLPDEQGTQTLWGWIRDFEIEEAPKRGQQDFSGCLSTPRRLSIQDGSLFQSPAPEVSGMRTDVKWKVLEEIIFPGIAKPIGCVKGQAIDMELTFTKGSSTAVGLVLNRFGREYENATIFYEWGTSTLQVVVDPVGFYPGAEGSRKAGGAIRQNMTKESHLKLRVLIDGSCIEIFTHTGEVLTTRVYRGPSTPACNPGIDFVAVGGACSLCASAYQVKSIWDGNNKLIEKPAVHNKVPIPQNLVEHSKSSLASILEKPWWALWSGIPANIVTH